MSVSNRLKSAFVVTVAASAVATACGDDATVITNPPNPTTSEARRAGRAGRAGRTEPVGPPHRVRREAGVPGPYGACTGTTPFRI